jgi:hypothetical protein
VFALSSMTKQINLTASSCYLFAVNFFSRPIEEMYALFVYHLKAVSVYLIMHGVVNRWVRVAIFFLSVSYFVGDCSSFCSFSFDRYIICPSTYSFWISIWYLLETHVGVLSWVNWIYITKSDYPWDEVDM